MNTLLIRYPLNQYILDISVKRHPMMPDMVLTSMYRPANQNMQNCAEVFQKADEFKQDIIFMINHMQGYEALNIASLRHALFAIIERHIKQHNRLTICDLELYIDDALIIFESLIHAADIDNADTTRVGMELFLSTVSTFDIIPVKESGAKSTPKAIDSESIHPTHTTQIQASPPVKTSSTINTKSSSKTEKISKEPEIENLWYSLWSEENLKIIGFSTLCGLIFYGVVWMIASIL